MATLLYRIGRAAARRAWLSISAWVVILGLSVGAFALFGGALTSQVTIPGTATEAVQDQLADRFPNASGGSGSVVFATTDGGAITPAQQAQIQAALQSTTGIDGVTGVIDPFATKAEVDDSRTQLDDGDAKIAAGRTQLDDGRVRLAEAQAQLDDGRGQIEAARSQAQAAGRLSAVQPQLDARSAQLDAAQQQIDAQEQTLVSSTAELEQQAVKAADARELLDLSSGVRQVSTDGTTAVGAVRFAEAVSDVPAETKDAIIAAIRDQPLDGVRVEFSQSLSKTSIELFGPGEIAGLAIAAITLFVMLGTLVAAGLPIVSAVIGVGIGVTASLSLSGVLDMLSVTPVLGVMLGLAVGIDYSLFILNRHRTQLRGGMELHESIGRANGTSGNAVVFAGTTVIIALLALNVTGIPFLGLMGTVGAICVAVAILLAVTLTPALLGLVGMHLLPRAARASLRSTGSAPARGRFRTRGRVGTSGTAPAAVTAMGTGRAVVTLIAGLAALVVIALPTLSMRLGLPDASSEPVASTQYQAYQLTADAFGAGANGPLVAVAELSAPVSDDDLVHVQAAVGTEIAGIADVAAVAPIGASDDRTLLAFQVVPEEGPTSASTEQLVHDLRDARLDDGVTLGVAGSASANIDISEKIGDALPLYLSVVVGLSLIILILVFRSILVPLTATVGFVLSLLAAFGGVTALFQWGWLSGLSGVHDPGPVLSFLPILLVGILFGLAMDYQLFLVSGMREAHVHGASARIAVQRGVHAGRTVVIAAALIMVSVFGGFLFSNSVIIQSLGFGLAFGVLADAFVVRLLLIPAAMHLLGESAWWIPRWLDRILPDVDVEGAKLLTRDADGDTPAAARR